MLQTASTENDRLDLVLRVDLALGGEVNVASLEGVEQRARLCVFKPKGCPAIDDAVVLAVVLWHERHHDGVVITCGRDLDTVVIDSASDYRLDACYVWRADELAVF